VSGLSATKTILNTSIAASIAASFLSPVGARADTPLTAATVLKEMPPNEFAVYIAGIVEGLAYARFRKDSAAAGQKDEAGMTCIRRWYFDDPQIALTIGNAFRKYGEHYPWVVVAALVKQECGE